MLHGELVTLRPATDEDVPALAAIRATAEVARWWGPDDTAEKLAKVAAELEADPDSGPTFFVIVAHGQVVGAIQWYAEQDPDFRHAGLDLYLDPAVHSRGLGTDAVRTMARHLITRHGFHRLIIDPAAANAAAIRAYTKVGFRPVGTMREYWRDPDGVWQDGLLLDLLADELV